MKKVMKTFLVLSLLGFFACNKKSGDLVLASSAGVQVNSSVIEKILQDLPEQSKSELENSKQAMEDFVMNTATQLASIDIIAKKAKEAGVEDGQDYKTRLSLGEQELLIRIFVAQKFTAKEEDLSDEQLRAEYDKIKATRSKEELKNFPEFEAVKARIKQQLVSQKAQEQFQAFVAPLTAKVEIDQANVAKVADDFYKGKDLDDKVVISKVGDASITVGDLLLSLGDISLEDVRKQVKSKQDFAGTVVVLCGDTPVLSAKTISHLIEHHCAGEYKCTVLTAKMDDPASYGRIVRDSAGELDRIVEYKDASDEIRRLQEINSGIYCFEAKFLFRALQSVNSDNAQGEYYLTDTIAILKSQGHKVGAFVCQNPLEITGVNSMAELKELEKSYKA